MYIGPYYIDVELILRVFTLTVMALGMIVIPILPGLVIIWVAALAYGLAAGFGVLGWVMFAIITVLMLVGSILDNVLMGTSAHQKGAPWWVILVAMVAAIAGNFIVPIIGGNPGWAAGPVLDRMASPFGLEKSPGFHERNVDRVGLGFCV